MLVFFRGNAELLGAEDGMPVSGKCSVEESGGGGALWLFLAADE